MIRNPVLTGFHPDPCFCRAGADYYLATSTFEWLPGVCIYHSRDLVNWDLIARPLDRSELLDLRGNPCSGGVWAPALSYANGLFWLVYTDMKHFDGMWKDARNYLTTTPSINGPWADPIPLNNSGFDPSLFHDEDGRKWLLNQQWNPHEGSYPFDGILIQEFDTATSRLVGKPRPLFQGTNLKVTEGPHLFRKDGYYYLVCAEGGTGWEHAVTVARSRQLDGPWEVHPDNPVLSSLHVPENPLQKAGHGSFLEMENGEWFMAHLCSRPQYVDGERRCMLGRETAIQRIVWAEDGWPRLAQGGCTPVREIQPPAGFVGQAIKPKTVVDFTQGVLPDCFHSLRRHITPDWADLSLRSGYLRLRGGESLHSRFEQSLLARRIEHFDCQASLIMEFAPEDYHQAAGLIVYYNLKNWAYLRKTLHPSEGVVVELLHCENSDTPKVLCRLPLETGEPAGLRLAMEIRKTRLRFSIVQTNGSPQQLAPVLDATRFSDDYVSGWGFTGAFVGLCCQDHAGFRRYADFATFEYENLYA